MYIKSKICLQFYEFVAKIDPKDTVYIIPNSNTGYEFDGVIFFHQASNEINMCFFQLKAEINNFDLKWNVFFENTIMDNLFLEITKKFPKTIIETIDILKLFLNECISRGIKFEQESKVFEMNSTDEYFKKMVFNRMVSYLKNKRYEFEE